MRETLEALQFLFIGPAIVVFLGLINLMTSPGHWWVQWPALGIGIAWFICLARVVVAALAAGGLVALFAVLRGR